MQELTLQCTLLQVQKLADEVNERRGGNVSRPVRQRTRVMKSLHHRFTP